MSSEVTVKNTLAFLFPGDVAQPAVADMVRFIKALNGDQSLMDTAYKISEEKSVFIRFKSEEAMNFVYENNEKSLPFHYTSGKKTMVRMSVAGKARYVRIFDLPPEVSDDDIASVMRKYGKVKRTVRERFPAEFQLDMFTGVRGVHMDVDKEIPDALFFRNRKGRIYYHGMTPKCFACQSASHLKKHCPVLREQQHREEKQKQPADSSAIKEEENKSKNETASAGAVDKPAATTVKTKKNTTKQQRSLDSVREQSPSSSETDSRIAVSSIPRRRIPIPTYIWIDDENERRIIIEEDKQRTAKAVGLTMDQITFYHDEFN